MEGSTTALVVDDDPITRAVVREALLKLGCAPVLEAGDGVFAQELLLARPDIDLVLTDIVMPRLDGLGLVKWARDHCPGPVWVILSALDRFEKAVEAIRLGAFDFLSKPIRAEELEVSVRNALEHRRLLIEGRRLHAELQDKVDELQHKSELLQSDLQRAEVIQRALLPAAPPALDNFRVNAIYRPGRYVGGDLYDVQRIGDRHLAFYVADAAGHGVTAAMLSVLFKQLLALSDAAGEPISPGVALRAVNASLAQAVNAPGLFLTAVCGLLDTSDGTLAIASAGHPPVIYRNRRGESKQLMRTGAALGVSDEATFTEHHLRLTPGDCLLVYTDGVLGVGAGSPVDRVSQWLDAPGGGEKPFLKAIAHEITKQRASGHDDEIDDVTVLLLEATPGESVFDNGDEQARTVGRGKQAERNPIIYYGESEAAWFLALRGRATWLHAEIFYEEAHALLDEHHALFIDLTACDYLDSTMLGTVHELVNTGHVQVCGAAPAVRAMFEELRMDAVLASVSDITAPTELLPLAADRLPAASRARMLRAHEALATLSEDNQTKFSSVLDELRQT